MTRLANACLLVLVATALDAQRYRVAVGLAGTTQTSVVEFRPCIPVEGSDCGAWIEKTAEAERLPAVTLPATQRETTPDGRFSITIRDGVVMIVPAAGKDRGQLIRATGLHGRATAIALSADSQFAFALTNGPGNEGSEVCMIYLDWRSVFARQTLPGAAAGLAIVR